jgi:hypothetical protein
MRNLRWIIGWNRCQEGILRRRILGTLLQLIYLWYGRLHNDTLGESLLLQTRLVGFTLTGKVAALYGLSGISDGIYTIQETIKFPTEGQRTRLERTFLLSSSYDRDAM